jgi:8-oxo-dGTP pyrophosphatase MutT (NUDIX family)
MFGEPKASSYQVRTRPAKIGRQIMPCAKSPKAQLAVAMAKSDRSGDVQYAALPYRLSQDGTSEVLLITSRGTGRWLIPKGWPMQGHQPHLVAATEAWQEAGIKGIIGHKPMGSYYYAKSMPNGDDRLCQAVVFLLRVTLEASTWREQTQRIRGWFPRKVAASMVDEGSLAIMIENLLDGI